MKLYIPSAHFSVEDTRATTELFFLIPYLQHTLYEAITERNGFWNSGCYSKLFLNTPVHQRVENIQDCDVVVLPYKYNHTDDRIKQAVYDAQRADKKVVAFYNDDNAGSLPIPDNLILFRTSLLGSKIHLQERVMPVIIPDHKPCTLSMSLTTDNLDISFCGHLEGAYREAASKYIHKHWLGQFNKIIRNGFWAPGLDKLQARREYYQNLADSSFTMCIRGGGNFSYRFYEALSFGKVPVLFDTDIMLPFSQWIDWDRHILCISPKELEYSIKSDKIIHQVLRDYSPVTNRELWKKWFSPEGYTKNWYKDL